MTNGRRPRARRASPLRATAIYLVVSFLWIALSDVALASLVPDGWLRSELSIFKGWAYVTVTATLVYWLVRSSVKATEEAAEVERASERQLRELLDRIDLLAAIFDLQGGITFANRSLLATTGAKEGELLGADCFERLVREPNARDRWREAVRTREADALRRPLEVEIDVRGGERRTVRWTTTLRRDSTGAIVGGLAIGEDVSDRLRFEDEIRQVQKMEALGRLAGSVAHDFNNLLTAISGYADLAIAELEPDNRVKEDVREIRRAADRASALTAQLLAFSRRRPSQAGPLDLAATVSGMEPMLRRLLGEQVELVVDAPQSCWISGDPTQIEQAVLNLAVNSRDVMADGGRVSISVSEAEPSLVRRRELLGGRPGPHVLLRVADTGPGIQPDALPHLFEPFFTTKPKGKGTGLGLAIVYSATQAAGGQVWAENTGGGARFNVLLPRCEPGEPVGVAAEPAPRGRGTERILVVEDDSAVRALVRTVLEREGYTVVEASGGEEALAIAGGGGTMDMLVTDVVMPGMSGRELVARLRSARRDLRVLFISGYDEDRELLESGESSLDGPLLRKPFTAGELGERVRSLLDADRVAAPPAHADAPATMPSSTGAPERVASGNGNAPSPAAASAAVPAAPAPGAASRRAPSRKPRPPA